MKKTLLQDYVDNNTLCTFATSINEPIEILADETQENN